MQTIKQIDVTMPNMFKQKVALGMSGGVDSSLSAHLLKEQGYEVTGVYLECWNQPGCRSDSDRKDALQVAMDLDIPFQVLDFTKEYQRNVIDDFFAQYKAGRTPNPDVLCNQYIKFGMFYDWAMQNGFDAIATGHYAKIVAANGDFELTVPEDKHKDQTYFLYRIQSHQLEKILFPLADFTKKQVRHEAQKRIISVADKKDSVGVCFIGNVNVRELLKQRLGENPGEVIDKDRNIIGKHKGLWFYTIGQRSGFTINQNTLVKKSDGTMFSKQNIPPFYVIGKIIDKNQLVVGFGQETLQHQFDVTNIHWINPIDQFDDLLVRIRHTGELLSCTLDLAQNADGRVMLIKPISGIAAGQSAVFYRRLAKKIVCLGGAIIA